MARTGEQAIAAGLAKMHAGYTFPAGTCLKQIRTLLDVPSYDFTPSNGRDPWAIEAFDFAKLKHPTSDPHKIPRGYPVFFRGRPGRPGHIALALGDGMCLSTDFPTGHFGVVSIAHVVQAWGMTLVGWTQDLNRVTIVSGATKPAAVVAKPAAPTRFDQINTLANELIALTPKGTAKAKAAWTIKTTAKPYIS